MSDHCGSDPHMRGLIRSAPDAALADALARALPKPVRILARRPSPYASSFPLAELDIACGDGARLTVVWKDLTPGALLPAARRARGGVSPDPSRELHAYELLEGAELGTPRRIAAVHEPGRAWLFLEAVRGARLEHVGERSAWEAAARWLARAHETLAARTDASWPPPWRPPDLDAPIGLAAPLAAARAWAHAAPLAVIHGELYAANVLIGDETRVCALDWETIARGPALLDLAALTAGRWDEPGEPLAEAYRRALPDPPPRERFVAELDFARLLTAARWLAAPAAWSPPPEQARDWLADAELVAGRIAQR